MPEVPLPSDHESGDELVPCRLRRRSDGQVYHPARARAPHDIQGRSVAHQHASSVDREARVGSIVPRRGAIYDEVGVDRFLDGDPVAEPLVAHHHSALRPVRDAGRHRPRLHAGRHGEDHRAAACNRLRNGLAGEGDRIAGRLFVLTAGSWGVGCRSPTGRTITKIEPALDVTTPTSSSIGFVARRWAPRQSSTGTGVGFLTRRPRTLRWRRCSRTPPQGAAPIVGAITLLTVIGAEVPVIVPIAVSVAVTV